ncbi:MAG: phage portal protein [Dehalococcoidales bacterium]|nr:phage portal protein [Dehalococcoidales bacterium]
MASDNFNPSHLEQLDLERMRNYRQMLDFYNGSQWQNRSIRSEKQLSFNYARAVIDKVTAYMMAGALCKVDADDDSEEAKGRALNAEKALQQAYADNNLEQLDFDTETDCAILGDACYKVTWDTIKKRVRVTAPDVSGIYAWWLGDDSSKIWRVASKYSLTADESVLLYGIKPAGKTAKIVELWTDGLFELWLDGSLIEKKANPYGFIPFVIFPNLREPKKFWGKSDITQLAEPQCELNRAMSQLSRILELSGNPIAVLENVEESEDIAVSPGAVWNIPEEAKAYLLDLLQGGGVNLHIEYINLLYRTLHDLGESPRATFGSTSGNSSGVALEIEMQPLLQKVWRKRLIRNTAYCERNRLILRLVSKYTGQDFGDCRLQMVWSPVLPRDMTGLVSSEQILVQNGIHSRRTAMSQIGIKSPESEFASWLEERAAILKMNNEHNTKTAVKMRERAEINTAAEGF